ncbi:MULTISPECIES: anthranilate synthase component I family protein [unclassified Marinobacterium]|jgi:anthranilate synthase component 1|uniref:anthranilate synthase component I family protein n=1 Tax=unclassified Marinobacterium TaxID=2644139 RepID=UPI001567CA8B|nr:MULTISPECIES: anthranilate synthase component I family protein [unclassified Marinobacterium]NRP16780.1 Aminodeoxychorismate synthase component 1 [Marinobacterium sp. xm-a-152]NRP26936.1 Aminodeoxychorismate synthase component 1 [Marinobacterium sp. xm-d-420]NRP36384.1 Aminodeoxychorismate synthase component 1 [Marinobacterium sp. xm-d-579]NRP52023.1 Aminodeoxychorismate synthase component 1 [Marinobacterium sp. xm-v-242]NRP57076.1 Aminodeoxychorismate synthase component 1 [Marinobacterium 
MINRKPAKIELPRKPQYVKMAADIDFFQLFKKIEKRFDNCVMLESLGEESYISRHSIIGFDPEQILWADEGYLHIEDRQGNRESYASENPYYLLREIVPQNIISRKYAGGLTGYIGYDCMNYFEPSLNLQHSEMFDIFRFGVFKDGLILDKMTGEVFYFYYTDSRIELVDEILASDCPANGPLKIYNLGDTMTQQDHADAVMKVKQDIIEGKIFQTEVGFKKRFRLEGDTINIYEQLREVNPSPQMYYVKFGEQKLIGASPELLFRLRQGEMETFPLAGTTKRGADAVEDQQLARALLNDPKEIAEHNMIVDLHRNDIGRVARFGTVKVRNLMDIKRFSHVQHISSEIVGIISDEHDMFSALASNFPAGTLTGAPKIEAMTIIDELEADGRGPYGGAVGHFSFNGDCTFAIPIRTVFANGEQAYVQTCGGNVYDSNPEDEYEEIRRKFAGTKKVLDQFMVEEQA